MLKLTVQEKDFTKKEVSFQEFYQLVKGSIPNKVRVKLNAMSAEKQIKPFYNDNWNVVGVTNFLHDTL